MPLKIYQLTTQATYLGQMILNRYHFLDSDGVADPLTLCADFNTHVLAALIPGQVQPMTYTGMLYQEVFPSVQVQREYLTGFPQTPGAGGTPTESFVAASIKWGFADSVILTPEVPQRHIRRGGKRISGIDAAAITDNRLTGASEITHLNAYIAALVAFPPDAWQFIICGFPKRPPATVPPTVVPQVPPNKYALVTGGTLSQYLGSQVSRKQGHGR